jgi:hypothetical protein
MKRWNAAVIGRGGRLLERTPAIYPQKRGGAGAMEPASGNDPNRTSPAAGSRETSSTNINMRAEISVSSFAVTSRPGIAVRSSGAFYSARSVTFALAYCKTHYDRLIRRTAREFVERSIAGYENPTPSPPEYKITLVDCSVRRDHRSANCGILPMTSRQIRNASRLNQGASNE